MNRREKAAALRLVAEDYYVMWCIGRRAIEDALIASRDCGISILDRQSGLAVRNPDGTGSDVMRMATDEALRIGMLAMAKHLESEE